MLRLLTLSLLDDSEPIKRTVEFGRRENEFAGEGRTGLGRLTVAKYGQCSYGVQLQVPRPGTKQSTEGVRSVSASRWSRF